ncbi:MAG TPA: TonB-dependent receptor, partial [Novosphingobium sp.]|nr:TonB-dependent receptor [Novosphingobium sp.]
GDVAMKRPYQTAAFSDPSHFANYATSYNRLQGDRIRWEFSYALPAGLSLTYAGGYDHQKFRHSTDASAADANGNLVGGATNFIQEENPSTWNHEVRLASDQSKRLTAQVGYFHFDEHNSNLNSGLIERSGPYNGQYLVHFLYDVKTKSDGVFGQLGYRLTDTVHLSGGARYTWDKKERTGASYLNCTITGYPAEGCNSDGFHVTPSNGNISESKPTFHIGVDWTPTARNMFYAKFDTGFKSGGFNSNGSAPSVNYGPETLKAWEVGTKNRFLGGHLTANADAFYQTYNGYQASQQTAVIAGSAAGVFNIGSAEIYGVEAQFAAQTSSGLRADVSGTYLHTRFTDAAPIVKGDGVTVVNVVGNQLPNAPKLVITAGLEQKIPVGHVSFTPRIEWKHSSSYYFSAFNDPDTRQGEYDTFNASLKFQPAARNVEIMLFVRNLTNQTIFAGMQENFNTTPYTNAYQFAPPRTYGVRASAKF